LKFYLDTSLVVTALVTEPESSVVVAWLEKQASTRLAISDWVITEFSAALSVKLRSGTLDTAARERALAVFGDLLSGEFECLPVMPEHFRLAATFANRSRTGLRGGDALHLAVAAVHGIKLCTRDRRLAEAGTGLGVLTEFVSPRP
jgi:predicted nucleic acid-binding protein